MYSDGSKLIWLKGVQTLMSGVALSASTGPALGAFLFGLSADRWWGAPVIHHQCTCWCDCHGTGRLGLAAYIALGVVLALSAERLCWYLRRRVATAAPVVERSPSPVRGQLRDISAAVVRKKEA